MLSQGAGVQGGQQQDSHELLGKLIEGMLAEELRAAKALQEQVSCQVTTQLPDHQCGQVSGCL